MLSMKKRNLVVLIPIFVLRRLPSTYQLPTRAIEIPLSHHFSMGHFSIFIHFNTFPAYSIIILSNTDKVENRKTLGFKISAYATILSISYLIFLPRLGFVLANILLFVGLMILYKEKRIIFLLTCSIAMPTVIFLIFKKIFSISLPVGILGGLF